MNQKQIINSNKLLGDKTIAWLFLMPALFIIGITYIYPLLFSLFLSFSSWDMLNIDESIKLQGIDNYIRVLTNPDFIDSFLRTIFFGAVSLIVQIILGMIIALLVTNTALNSKFTLVVRSLLLLPLITSPVVAGILWRILFNVEYGPINYLLGILGFEQQLWIADPSTALWSVIIVEIWINTSFVVFVLTGALLSMDREPYEAAMVDGANLWQNFWYITLPQLKPVLIIIILLRTMDLFKMFDYIYSMTYGGPGKSTELLTLFIFKQGTQYLDITGAAASSWLLLFLLLPFNLYFLKKIRSQE